MFIASKEDLMQPVIVMPMHDPAGIMFPNLKAITPQLKSVFAKAFVSVTSITYETQSSSMAWLRQDEFFQALYHQSDISIGRDFSALYAHAAAACAPDQILHLCFIDRVAFALQSDYRGQFLADIQAVRPEDTPLIFQRSKAAWDTHPSNYRELEAILTHVGRLLFKKDLDFAWCHLAIQARQLAAVLPYLKNTDLSLLAEIVVRLRDQARTQDVDWLAWEDPFIYSRDARELKAERERSDAENRKRLAYVIPKLQVLYQAILE
jgi:hypothetical protein